MLVLARKLNQKIIIDGQIEIEIVKIKGNTIRLGITAPQDVKILRSEVMPIEVDVEVEGDLEVGREADLNEVLPEEIGQFESETIEHLPNPFAIAHAS